MKSIYFQQVNGMIDAKEIHKGGDQNLILSALHEIEKNNEKNAVGLVNALFQSSTSHALDKMCLNIFSKLGDQYSLQLLHKKYPTPESISLSLLPYYVKAIGFLGGKNEVGLLAKTANTFWGMYRNEIITAFEQICRRIGKIDVSDEVVKALQDLFDASDELLKKRILEICSFFSHHLILSIFLCGIESEISGVRKEAIAALGKNGTDVAHSALLRAFKKETNEDLLDDYAYWLSLSEKYMASSISLT